MRLFFILLVSIRMAWSADATIEVVKGVESLPSLVIENGSSVPDDASQKMFKMLVADMNVVSLFNVNEAYSATAFDATEAAPVHKDAQFVLRYRLVDDNEGGYRTDVKLLQNGISLFAKSYHLKQAEMLVFLSHSIAYDINAKLGGAPLEWMKNKVLFVRLTSPRHSDIVAADYTLSYQRVILSGGMYSFAKWANREQTELYYTSLSDPLPSIYKMNLQSGKREKLISSDGMAVCSDVNQNGKKLLLTLAPGGQPDIYLYDVETRGKTRLTDYSGIDVNGQFLGEDKMAFVSNRLGYPTIFSKRFDSTAVMQLVYQGKNNSTYSSYKDYIVYKARENSGYGGNTFNLHLASLNSSNIRRLTASGENEYPRFSGDGEAILFIKHEGNRSLVGVIRVGLNKSFTFPLKIGKIQSIDW